MKTIILTILTLLFISCSSIDRQIAINNPKPFSFHIEPIDGNYEYNMAKYSNIGYKINKLLIENPTKASKYITKLIEKGVIENLSYRYYHQFRVYQVDTIYIQMR